MKFSIITVCKNAEKAITRTLESVVTQTCKDIEYIIIDGASTDGTVDIIKQYAEKYDFIKWISEPDTGIYQAMNKGIMMATGDFLNFLNAGDYYIHYNVVKMIEGETLVDTDVLHGICCVVSPFSGKHYLAKVPEYIDKYYFYKFSVPHPSIFYRKRLFDLYGLYNENYDIISDHIFNMKIFCDNNLKEKHIDNIFVVFIADGVSFTDKVDDEKDLFLKEFYTKEELMKFSKRFDMEKRKKTKGIIMRFLNKINIIKL